MTRNHEEVDTLILGAGPAGLTAAFTLAKAGHPPVILEKCREAGGLMRSIRRGDCVVDIGRKELYNRLPSVDRLWSELLGQDYRPYPHRGGILYDGQIIEISPTFRGFRRGMSWRMVLGCAFDFLNARLSGGGGPPRNLEEYFYRQRGRLLTRVVSQGFQEKLAGRSWADVPLPSDFRGSREGGVIRTLAGVFVRTFSRSEVNTSDGRWRHPARGTGQICAALEQGAAERGARFRYDVEVVAMSTGDGVVRRVTADIAGRTVVYRPRHVISTLPSHALLKLLFQDRFDSLDVGLRAPPSSRKTIVLAYLFFREAPRFPHAWLNVTCRKTRIGRITNYSALGGEMIPQGKSGLCCEFFCPEGDPLLERDDDSIAELALAEGARAGVMDRSTCVDRMVLRLPGADASQNRHNWMTSMRRGLVATLAPFRNLYFSNRTDLDIATMAGLESAEAILSGDRATFDRHVDPSQLDIRSTRKAFEFRNPLEADA